MKKILLTGTNFKCLWLGRKGFIASRFLELYKDDYDIEEFNGDIRESKGIDLSEYDMVVHLAALAGVRLSHEIPDEYWETNVVASKHLFESCKKYNVPIVYASSSSVYEWWLSPYATSKYAMEALAPDGSIGLRFHTVYGPNSRTDMLYDMLQKRDSKLTYITEHTRDWTHVDDVCLAIALCVDNYDKIPEKAIDVGNGQPVTVKEMADKIWPGNNLPVKAVTGERENTCANPTVLLSHGWQPQHHILED
jgi:UDP-glucuronate 4-epimerase